MEEILQPEHHTGSKKGHPKGLYVLFTTEMWERFNFYGMRALLTLFLVNALAFSDKDSSIIYGGFLGLCYLTPMLGGFVADRYLGNRNCIMLGGLVMGIGQLLLFMSGSTFDTNLELAKTLMWIALGTIILGNGFFKPNISSMVGQLYHKGDNRLDSAFTIFYMGINLGGFLAPIIVGEIGMNYSFHLGFGLAAVGMLLGLIVFMMTKKKNLGLAGTVVPNPLSKEEKKKVYSSIGIAIVVLAIILAITIPLGFLTFESFITIVGILGFLIPAIYFTVMYRSPKTTRDERSRLIAYIPLFLAAVMFWAIQEQGSTILATYADKRTQLEFAGFHLSPTIFQSINPLFIIIFAPVFAWIWVKLGNRQPSVSKKFSIALLFAGLSFIIMMLPAYLGGENTLVSPLWLVLSYFLVVVGELCLSPVGLSATTKLAPKAFSAQTMSLWFLSSAAAQALNAQIAPLFTKISEVAYFGILGGVAILLSIILFLLSPMIQNKMKGIK